MKFKRVTLIPVLFILTSTLLCSQNNFERNDISIPVNKSILFGFDTYLNNKPLQDQHNAVICSAYNGWLYAAYSYYNDSAHRAAITMLRSKNNGVTWSILHDKTAPFSPSTITKLSMIIGGHDSASLKIFLGIVIYDSSTNYRTGWVSRFNANTGIIEAGILNENSLNIRDLTLTGDGQFPASYSNPYSIGVLYSKYDGFNNDTVVFQSSGNGGNSFNSRTVIAYSSHYLGNVSLAYGRSSSCSSGRYYAAWEEKENQASSVGHIYTSHSEPNFNNAFTTPFRLDSLDNLATNKARNPVIACQNSAFDNDSSNLTSLVLFEKYRPATNDFNIVGTYNEKSTGSGNFHTFSLNSSGNNQLQPDCSFNPYDSTFMVTYYDSTLQKLPYVVHNFNMHTPEIWTLISGGYNDDNNLDSPHPKVSLDHGLRSGMNIWISKRPEGNGAAMFDAPFIYYTGFHEITKCEGKLNLFLYPNPSSEFTTIEFELPSASSVVIELINTLGASLFNKSYPELIAGKHDIKLFLMNCPEGTYFIKVRAKSLVESKSLVVVK